MIYLISQEWSNTSNNHAGMKYLCDSLQNINIQEIKSISVPVLYVNHYDNKILNKLYSIYVGFKYKMILKDIFKTLKKEVSSGDKIVLMEYMETILPLKTFASRCRKRFPNVSIYAMVHLVPSKLDKSIPSNKKFKKWIEPIDKILTLGHSLTDYLVSRGCLREKIVTTFHYVDNLYYKRSLPLSVSSPIKVIAMGNQMRNIELLYQVVHDNPNVEFTICQGVCDMSNLFKGLKNVRLIPFVPERELKTYMEESDVSLNVMKDTIGSNVITTSMAMGLAMICSDVGSIRDYCNDDNCIFCKNITSNDFSSAIQCLVKDSSKLYSMKKSSIKQVENYTIDKFYDFIMKL